MQKIIKVLLLPLLILIIWSLLTSLHIIPEYILPSPEDVLTSLIALTASNEIFIDTITTFTRVAVGFILAAAIAVPLGIIIGWSKSVETFSNLTIQVLRPIPPLAWIPFALLWFGLGFQSAVFIIFIGTFFPILLNTIDGVKRVNKIFIESAYTLGASERQILPMLLCPHLFRPSSQV